VAKHREVLVVGQLLDAVGKEIARLVGYRCPDRHVRQFPGAGGERPRGPNPNSKARRPRQRTKVLTEGEALERLREVSRIEIKSIAALGALWGWERSRTSKAVTRWEAAGHTIGSLPTCAIRSSAHCWTKGPGVAPPSFLLLAMALGGPAYSLQKSLNRFGPRSSDLAASSSHRRPASVILIRPTAIALPVSLCTVASPARTSLASI